MHLAHLQAPDLWPPRDLPKETNDQIRGLNAAVYSLRYHVEKFAAALELYRFARSRPAGLRGQLVRDWQWIAINESAMQIWYLREAMDLLRRTLVPACRTVASLVDESAMTRAICTFDTYFPEFKKMRNAVAHSPSLELASTKSRPKEQLYAGPQIKEGDRFELVNDGVRYSMEMTTGTLDQLTEVLLTFWAAFEPVESGFDKLGRSE